MVWEGLRSLTSNVTRVTGYRLRDVSISSPLIVPSTEGGVEVQLQMGSHGHPSNKDLPVFDFAIHSVAGGEWKAHCSGKVVVEQDDSSDTVSEDWSSGTEKGISDKWNESCSASIDRLNFYRALHQKGANFGPIFQTLQDIHFNEQSRAATAQLPFREWRRRVRKGELTQHLIHPSTLDGLIHVLFASVYNNLTQLPTMVPNQVSEVYVSHDLLADNGDDAMRLYGSITKKGISSLEGNVMALNSMSDKHMVALRGVRLVGLQAAADGHGHTERSCVFHQIDWKPDVSLLSKHGIEDYCRRHTANIPGGGIEMDSENVCRYFLSNMVRQVAASGVEISKSSHEKYFWWAKSFLDQEKDSTMALARSWSGFEDEAMRPHLVDAYACSMPRKKLVVAFGYKLLNILTDKIDPLEILFNDGLAESLYQSPLFNLTAHRLAAYMDLLAHKNSDLNIIEVGAGTGSTTDVLLDTLCLQGRFAGTSPRFRHYDFTDLTPTFFANAQERYELCSGRMRFKTLDIERDPEEQGFEPGSYDVVIAAAVSAALLCLQFS